MKAHWRCCKTVFDCLHLRFTPMRVFLYLVY